MSALGQQCALEGHEDWGWWCAPLSVGCGSHVSRSIDRPDGVTGAHQEVRQALGHTSSGVTFPLLDVVTVGIKTYNETWP